MQLKTDKMKIFEVSVTLCETIPFPPPEVKVTFSIHFFYFKHTLLLCARLCSKCFPKFTTSNPPNNPMKWIASTLTYR